MVEFNYVYVRFPETHTRSNKPETVNLISGVPRNLLNKYKVV